MTNTEPAAMSTDELRELLYAGCAATGNRYHAAAIDLVDFAGLLDRAGVRAHVEIGIHVDEGARVSGAWINWANLAHAEVGPLSWAQDGLLRLAVSIAHDDIGVDLRRELSDLDDQHARAVLAAMARALGIDADIEIVDSPAYLERRGAREA